jgi:hypothetical protein
VDAEDRTIEDTAVCSSKFTAAFTASLKLDTATGSMGRGVPHYLTSRLGRTLTFCSQIGLTRDRQKVPLLCVLEPFLARNELIVTP